jgi:hypothetical protein
MRIATFVAVMLAGASPAEAIPGYCDDLQLVIRSVRDNPAFSSVTRANPRPALALFGDCRAGLVPGFNEEIVCRLPPGPATPSVETLAGEAALCLPTAHRIDYEQARSLGEIWLSFDVLIIKIGQDSDGSGNRARITVMIPEG